MVSVSGSMQWRCGVCNAAKPVGTGGICARCRKFACTRHLRVVQGETANQKVCTACLVPEDQVQGGLRGLLGRLLP